jgi:hypothetical protein
MSLLKHLQKIPGVLRSIAELRVQGKNWENVSLELKQPVNEIRELVAEKEEEFLQQIKKARAEQRQLCFDMAVDKLRQQTQSTNEKISHSAANMLIRMKMAEDRLRQQKLKARQPQKLVVPPAVPNKIASSTIEKITPPLSATQFTSLVDEMAARAILRNEFDLGTLTPAMTEMANRISSEAVMSVKAKK